MARPWIRDRSTALLLGYGMVIAGWLLLRDAYEHRNKPRPAWSSFLPS